ncbi:hypothetical protein GDO86_006790 [Hymenochirus boettgeri]|uniref:Olfactory receptor n=1 Tax=Hymenochirus boettgeri TaxID=247094 RepID=A0A8T2JC73_9PIPI|nr:hypothetical protein GDO86_006790 [Hymenochirus boettgeri]
MGISIENSTFTEFHISSFYVNGNIQVVLFAGVLLMYLSSVFGNVTITVLVCLVSKLHTPMYFFLCNLAVQDIVFVSTTLPKLMAVTLTGDTSISFNGCITQMFMFILCVTVEFFLLTFMAYDRYVAICRPLCYLLIMTQRLCILFASLSWIFGAVHALLYYLLIHNLSFCNIKDINHFYCELKAVLRESCGDISYIKNLFPVESVFLGMIPFVLILISYGYIIRTILKIHSSAGRAKTFSSCSSHLTIVIIFCGTLISMYVKPDSQNYQELEKVMSLLYTAVVPMLNPLIYSLRNKDVLKAMGYIMNKYK